MPPSWPTADSSSRARWPNWPCGARGRLVVTTPDTADAARVLKEQGVGDVVVTEGDGAAGTGTGTVGAGVDGVGEGAG